MTDILNMYCMGRQNNSIKVMLTVFHSKGYYKTLSFISNKTYSYLVSIETNSQKVL